MCFSILNSVQDVSFAFLFYFFFYLFIIFFLLFFFYFLSFYLNSDSAIALNKGDCRAG